MLLSMSTNIWVGHRPVWNPGDRLVKWVRLKIDHNPMFLPKLDLPYYLMFLPNSFCNATLRTSSERDDTMIWPCPVMKVRSYKFYLTMVHEYFRNNFNIYSILQLLSAEPSDLSCTQTRKEKTPTDSTLRCCKYLHLVHISNLSQGKTME